MLVAANKCDIVYDEDVLNKFKAYIEEKGYPLFEISAATHMGVRELIGAAAAKLAELPPPTLFEPEYVEPELAMPTAEELEITVSDGVWSVEGEWMVRLVRNVNFSDYESRMFFDRTLRNAGVYDRLEEMGISEGDTVSIYDLEFEYHS